MVSELPAFRAGSGVVVWVLEEAEHPPGGYVFPVLLIRFEELQVAKGLGATQIEIMSNTILEPAIGLYKSVGFVEIPLTSNAYARGNISLRLDLSKFD